MLFTSPGDHNGVFSSDGAEMVVWPRSGQRSFLAWFVKLDKVLGFRPNGPQEEYCQLWCWPCGQNPQPKLECHQRRDQRHEAGGVGYSFDRGAGSHF